MVQTDNRYRACLILMTVLSCSGFSVGAEVSDGVGESALPETTAGAAPPLPVVLDLDQAQRRALADNPSLQAAQARVKQARERVKQTRSLYFPQVQATYSATHTHLPNAAVDAARNAALQGGLSAVSGQLQAAGRATDRLAAVANVGYTGLEVLRTRDRIDEAVESYNASITASFLLFDGFSRKFTHAIAKFGARESEAGQQEARRLLLEAVASAYHGVQLARERIEIARADEAFNERLLKDAQARRRQGAGSLSDVLNFEVRLRAARAALLAAQRDYEIARVSLATLMGIPDAQLPEDTAVARLASEAPEDMALPVAEAMIQDAMTCRPDLVLSRYSTKRTQATIGQRRSAYYPQVAVFASRDASRSEDSHFDGDDVASTVGLSVSLDLFTGGRNRAAVAEAKYAHQEALHQLEDTELAAVSEVRQALADLHTAQEQLILQRTTAEYVEKNRDLVEKEYKAGQGALTRLNQAQRDLTEAQAQLALARVSLRQAWHTLRTVTGATLDAFAEEE